MSETRWPGVVITLWHYFPRSKGARVVVSRNNRHIVSSASHEGMPIDDPNIINFLDWAKDWYEGAPVREVSEEKGRELEAELSASPVPRKRRRTPPTAGGGQA